MVITESERCILKNNLSSKHSNVGILDPDMSTRLRDQKAVIQYCQYPKTPQVLQPTPQMQLYQNLLLPNPVQGRGQNFQMPYGPPPRFPYPMPAQYMIVPVPVVVPAQVQVTPFPGGGLAPTTLQLPAKPTAQQHKESSNDRRKYLNTFTEKQYKILNRAFRLNHHPCEKEKHALIKETGLAPKQIKNCFANQRARLRKRGTEGSY